MKLFKMILIPTLITLAIGGGYLYSVWKHRQDPGVVGRVDPDQQRTLDDVAEVRRLSAAHFEDTLALQGTSVWIKNGYTLSYFPVSGGHPVFAKPAGVAASLAKLDIKKMIKVSVPDRVDDGMGHGTRQVMAIFTFSGKADQFAMPVGAIDGNNEFYYCDLIFFYDEPHGIYNYWPKDVWSAIDAHQVKPGMNELQTRLAIGQKIQADSDQEGNRTVTYDQGGKVWTVTFRHNQATQIKQG